ncbi:hypothetical protein MNV49_006859 [Pseudohyphozyma bogoriensis]|nr:hypothetical protein MNV49_006859 [Pseudohyphozyma bogoriensis]
MQADVIQSLVVNAIHTASLLGNPRSSGVSRRQTKSAFPLAQIAPHNFPSWSPEDLSSLFTSHRTHLNLSDPTSLEYRTFMHPRQYLEGASMEIYASTSPNDLIPSAWNSFDTVSHFASTSSNKIYEEFRRRGSGLEPAATVRPMIVLSLIMTLQWHLILNTVTVHYLISPLGAVSGSTKQSRRLSEASTASLLQGTRLASFTSHKPAAMEALLTRQLLNPSSPSHKHDRFASIGSSQGTTSEEEELSDLVVKETLLEVLKV